MTPKKTVASLVAALALGASIAGPALAAAPVSEGPYTCTRQGEPYDFAASVYTKKEMATWRKYWVHTTEFCDKGSVDFSAMVKVTTP